MRISAAIVGALALVEVIIGAFTPHPLQLTNIFGWITVLAAETVIFMRSQLRWFPACGW